MSSKLVYNKNRKGSPGDLVSIQVRGGHQEGRVEKIVFSEEEAAKEDMKHPPKVVFMDRHEQCVAHNSESLEDLDKY